MLLRRSSSTRGINDLDVERHYGDVFDLDAVRTAMTGCSAVFCCVVDAQGVAARSAPLFRTTMSTGSRCARYRGQGRTAEFVFASTIGAVAVGANGRVAATSIDPFIGRARVGPYIESQRQAKDLVLRYARRAQAAAVAMCISNACGP